MTTSIEKVNPGTLPDAPSMGYSQITTCDPGKLIFISGQVAWTPAGDEVPEGLHEQTLIAMGNVVKALDAVDATVEHITSMRMYLVDPTDEDFQVPVAALRSYFGNTIPTFTALGVTRLGGRGLKIELEATAVL